MSEPNVPPPAKAPAKAAKGLLGSLKGHPPWLYAVVIAGAVAAAWYIRQRQLAAAAAVPLSGVDGAPETIDGYASAGYDSSAYPGATQGAGYWGQSQPGDEQASTGLGWTDQFQNMLDLFGQMQQMAQPVGGGGGGAPDLPQDVHTPPTPDVGPGFGPVYTPPPPPPATQAPPKATASGPQPTMGPGIFYNADRKLRYIVQKTNGKNYRRYESRLNKGDWGKGGVIPQ